ncbi:MAG: type II toxin-antitoxin system HicA family toxin [Methanobacteriota archaeon]
MTRLPRISGKELVKILSKTGYIVIRQRGSHVRMKDTSAGARQMVTVPMHDTLKPGLLLHIIKDAGLTVDDILRLQK